MYIIIIIIIIVCCFCLLLVVPFELFTKYLPFLLICGLELFIHFSVTSWSDLVLWHSLRAVFFFFSSFFLFFLFLLLLLLICLAWVAIARKFSHSAPMLPPPCHSHNYVDNLTKHCFFNPVFTNNSCSEMLLKAVIFQFKKKHHMSQLYTVSGMDGLPKARGSNCNWFKNNTGKRPIQQAFTNTPFELFSQGF